MVLATHDPETVAFMWWLAEQRQLKKRRRGVPNRRVEHGRPEIETEMSGILGELTLGRYLGIEWQADALTGGRHGKSRVTHVHPSGITLRANCSTIERFIASSVADFGADIGVLIGEGAGFAEAMIFGAISRAEFARLCRPAVYQGAACVEVPRRDLPHTPAELVRRLEGGDDAPPALREIAEQPRLFEN